MSILDAFVTSECGLVGVDTETSLPEGGFGEVSKMFALPHMNAVIALRGSGLLLVSTVMCAVAAGGDFDRLVEKMPMLLMTASNEAVRAAAQLQMAEDFAGCAEVVLVGFSPQLERIVGHLFKRETLDGEFAPTNDIESYVSPHWGGSELGFENLGSLAALKSSLKTLALTQSRLVREREPTQAAGGRLIVAEIRRGSMMIERVCDFPRREETAIATGEYSREQPKPGRTG